MGASWFCSHLMGQLLVVMKQSRAIWYCFVGSASVIKCGFVPVNMLTISKISGKRNGVPRSGAAGPEPLALYSLETLCQVHWGLKCLIAQKKTSSPVRNLETLSDHSLKPRRICWREFWVFFSWVARGGDSGCLLSEGKASKAPETICFFCTTPLSSSTTLKK